MVHVPEQPHLPFLLMFLVFTLGLVHPLSKYIMWNLGRFLHLFPLSILFRCFTLLFHILSGKSGLHGFGEFTACLYFVSDQRAIRHSHLLPGMPLLSPYLCLKLLGVYLLAKLMHHYMQLSCHFSLLVRFVSA